MAAIAGAQASKFAGVKEQLAKLNPSWEQTMLRVRDPKASVAFYKENFGMCLVDELHFGPDQGDFSLFFMATLPKEEQAALPPPGSPEARKALFDTPKGVHYLELTWNHGTEKLDPASFKCQDEAGRPQLHASGNSEPRGFGHIAFNVADVYAASEALEAKGVKFKKRPDEGRMKGLAFCLDPDGYWIELVKGQQQVEPERFNLSQTMLRVKDHEASIAFYRDLFNMRVVTERHFEPEKGDFSLYFLVTPTDKVDALLAEDAELLTKRMWDPALELTHNHGTESADGPVYHNGNDTTFGDKQDVPRGFGHIGFLVDDLEAFCALLEQVDVPFIKKPSDGRMKGIAFIKDPTGYWIELIQRGCVVPTPDTAPVESSS